MRPDRGRPRAATASGRLAPFDRLTDPDLTYDGRPPVLLEADAGDVALFVSDVWHRGTPASGGDGRLFLQVPLRPARHRPAHPHDGRGQPPLARGDRASRDATAQRDLVGLHDPFFYDG